MDGHMNALQWLGGDDLKPVAMRAWDGDHSLARTFLTRDEARIRDVLSKVFVPHESYLAARFPESIEGLRLWTEDKVVLISNHDEGHDFDVVCRNPPTEPDHGWRR